jgi:hypothetical protein
LPATKVESRTSVGKKARWVLYFAINREAKAHYISGAGKNREMFVGAEFYVLFPVALAHLKGQL